MKSLRLLRFSCFVLAIPVVFAQAQAQIVPGTGIRMTNVGDDFEDPKWKWWANGEKASREQDNQERRPLGASANGRWFESPKRGQPDVIERVPTPEGGIPGSNFALKLQSLNTGVPYRPSGKMEQDDFVMACSSRIGITDAGRGPSCTVRVWLPPFENWENRSGAHFGYRVDCKTTTVEKKKGFLFSRTKREQESYWPGFFFEFHSKDDPRYAEDDAVLLIRGDNLGREVRGPKLTPGWWTLGMSVSPDGRVHYYASPGVDDLRPEDHLYSSFPYSYTAEQFATHFFNTVNMNDGRTWSTPFIIDDPAVFRLR
ncbi:MAG: hypothetical protein NXI04_17735 [Planctomycetaceae bacterium]|nr:hypothetical protein [Planctomycetaceae bacterium]